MHNEPGPLVSFCRHQMKTCRSPSFQTLEHTSEAIGLRRPSFSENKVKILRLKFYQICILIIRFYFTNRQLRSLIFAKCWYAPCIICLFYITVLDLQTKYHAIVYLLIEMILKDKTVSIINPFPALSHSLQILQQVSLMGHYKNMTAFSAWNSLQLLI